MSEKTFVKLARGAAASLAVGCLAPTSQPVINNAIPAIDISTIAEQPKFARVLEGSLTSGSISIVVKDIPTEWSKTLEKEFRSLAAEEARGTIDRKSAVRLGQLDSWRERLLVPRDADEILFQMKRDNMLEKMSKTFQDYVQYKQGASHQRRPSV